MNDGLRWVRRKGQEVRSQKSVGKHERNRLYYTDGAILSSSYSNVRAQDLHSGFNVGDQQFWPMGVRHLKFHPKFTKVMTTINESEFPHLLERCSNKILIHSWEKCSFDYKIHTVPLQVKWAFVMIKRHVDSPGYFLVCVCVFLEWNWANNWQRRSRQSWRMPQRSTPTTHLPTASLTSSRRTLPESYFLFSLLHRYTSVFLLFPPHSPAESLHLSVCTDSSFYACFCSPSQGNKMVCILLRRQWKRIPSGIGSK